MRLSPRSADNKLRAQVQLDSIAILGARGDGGLSRCAAALAYQPVPDERAQELACQVVQEAAAQRQEGAVKCMQGCTATILK